MTDITLQMGLISRGIQPGKIGVIYKKINTVKN